MKKIKHQLIVRLLEQLNLNEALSKEVSVLKGNIDALETELALLKTQYNKTVEANDL